MLADTESAYWHRSISEAEQVPEKKKVIDLTKQKLSELITPTPPKKAKIRKLRDKI